MVERTLEHPAVLLGSVHEIGGLRAGLRLARSSDAQPVREFLEGLSPETRFRRFGTPVPRVTGSLVRHFAFADGRSRFVVLATAPVEHREQVIGLADAALVRSGAAEVAFVVADALQGRGVGRLLGEAIAALAARRGVRRLRAEVGGPAALALMKRLGPTVTTVEDGSPVTCATLPVPDDWAPWPAVEIGERWAG